MTHKLVVDSPWGRLNPNVAEQYERSLKVLCPTCKRPPGKLCITVLGTQAARPHIPRIKKSWELRDK